MNTQPQVEDIIKIIDDNYNEYKGSNEAILHAAEDIIELFKSNSEPAAPIDKTLSAKGHLEFYNIKNQNIYDSMDPDIVYGLEFLMESYSNLRVEQAKEEWRKN